MNINANELTIQLGDSFSGYNPGSLMYIGDTILQIKPGKGVNFDFGDQTFYVMSEKDFSKIAESCDNEGNLTLTLNSLYEFSLVSSNDEETIVSINIV